MTVQDLIKVSGDSVLNDYSYKDGEVFLNLSLDELDQTINLRIKTNLLAFNVSENSDLPHRTCFLELVKLSDVLNLNHGIYIASNNFGEFMKEKRCNLNLAYGLRVTDYEFIFSLSSTVKLASFIIKKLEDVAIECVNR